MSLAKVVADIRAVKIQGAQNIAFSALDAMGKVAHSSHATSVHELIDELSLARMQLTSARPTEPFLRNYMAGVFSGMDLSSLRSVRESVLGKIAQLKKEHRQNFEHIIHIGSHKVPRGSTVFTHCHSSTVVGVLKAAHDQGKRIVVANTEARPLFQGRTTAAELAQAGIAVHHMVDSAAMEVMAHADIMLIGADAITPSAVINKVGSSLFCLIAQKFEVPVYVCTHALKFDPQTIKGKKEIIEQRNPNEVWPKAPKRVTVYNPAFDEVKADLIAGIISELGVFSHSVFMQEVRRAYPWAFA